MTTENKNISIEIKEVSDKGIIKGYASTNDLDLVDDIVDPSAFDEDIKKHKNGSKVYPLFLQHNSSQIAGFITKMDKTSDGLYIEGKLYVDGDDFTDAGKSFYLSAKSGVIKSFSIGYYVKKSYRKEMIRYITELELTEVSGVINPANPNAKISYVKSLIENGKLEIAPNNHVYNDKEVKDRINEYCKKNNESSDIFKYPFFDIIEGKCCIVKSQFYKFCGAVNGLKNGLDISIYDRTELKNELQSYYNLVGKSFDLNGRNPLCFLQEADDLEEFNMLFQSYAGINRYVRKSVMKFIQKKYLTNKNETDNLPKELIKAQENIKAVSDAVNHAEHGASNCTTSDFQQLNSTNQKLISIIEKLEKENQNLKSMF